ncbi:hypothetical protein OUZ56_029524 [Daphnia magna]|uniref:Uncharacterized protein n=1 Tax=Daphnia magna TaxID=35525 RepID=A0ABR0B730_9CRUS|nr:hypothetical protein OUZ56_029524 [Daphnia magna]
MFQMRSLDLALFEAGEYSDDINSIVNSVSAWGVELYENETFPREDYCELLELTLVYLGVPVFPFAFRKPGLLCVELIITRDLWRTAYTT